MKELEARIYRYLRARNWHELRPADIAKSIMIEGAELLEIFQWENLSLSEVKNDKKKLVAIQNELADVLIYAIEMSTLLELDTEKIIKRKLAHVAKKYPAKLMRKTTREPGTESEYLRIKSEYRRKEN